MTIYMKRLRYTFFSFVIMLLSVTAYGQQTWEEGELEAVEIEIIKERQITLPKANRNFEKIPPKPSEPIKPAIQYDFRPFNFQTAPISPAIRPLKLKEQNPSKVYGGYVSAGYGNYASPYLEGFINTRRDKNKLVGAHAYLNSSDKGPVDGRNSGGGSSGVSVFGKTFNEYVALSADAGFENRSTHFYGYPEGTDVSAADIKQSYNHFKLSGELSNTKNSDFSYKLGAGFQHLSDKYDAKETEIDLDFNSGYKISDESQVAVKAGYYLLNRKDALVDAKGRSLFVVNPRYEFTLIEDLKFSAGFVAAVENDTIDSKNVHLYPDVRASYPLSPSVSAVASLTGGIEKVSLQFLSRENLWIAPNIPIFHTNKLYDLQAALQARIGNKVSVSGGFSFAALKNWYFFINDPTDQSKFLPAYDPGTTTRMNLFASLGFVQTESAKFLLRGDFYTYGTDNIDEPYHRPTYKFTGDASFNIFQKLLLDVNLIAQGGMKALKTELVGGDALAVETVKLDPAFDLNVRTEYLFSDSFSFFVQLNNITSNKYPVFLNYPVRGFQVLGGVTWSF
jgi:hypothetical protein